MAGIVLIEGSPAGLAVFSRWLEKAGQMVAAADNAEDGLEPIGGQIPDLARMDAVLPGMHGFQATRALARDQAAKDMPVLLVSTKAMETDKAWGLRQGASDDVVKPPRANDLIANIETLPVR